MSRPLELSLILLGMAMILWPAALIFYGLILIGLKIPFETNLPLLWAAVASLVVGQILFMRVTKRGKRD